jgi:hypothetical protein
VCLNCTLGSANEGSEEGRNSNANVIRGISPELVQFRFFFFAFDLLHNLLHNHFSNLPKFTQNGAVSPVLNHCKYLCHQ